MIPFCCFPFCGVTLKEIEREEKERRDSLFPFFSAIIVKQIMDPGTVSERDQSGLHKVDLGQVKVSAGNLNMHFLRTGCVPFL